MSTTSSLAKGTAWGLSAVFLMKFVGFFYYIILARLVDTEELGLFFLALSIINIVMLVSNLGLGSGAIARYVPYYSGEGRFNHVRRVVRVSVTAGSVFSLFFMVALILLAPELAAFFHNEGLVNVIYIMAFHIVIYNFYMIFLNFLQGRKLIRLMSELNGTQTLLKLGITMILIFLVGRTASSVALGFILSFMFAGIVGARWAFREYRSMPVTAEPVDDNSLLREMVPFGLTVVLLSSMTLVNSQFDRIMLGYFLPEEINVKMIGIYSIVVSFAALLHIFASSIGGIFYPTVTEFWGKHNVSEIKKSSAIFFRWLVLSTTPFLLTVLVYPEIILTIVYGEFYREGYIALILYSLGVYMYAFSNPVQQILSAIKRLDITIKIIGTGAVINILLNFHFIPSYGMNGAALTSAISLTVMTVLFLRLKDTVYITIPRSIYKSLAAGLFTLMPLLFIKVPLTGLLESIPEISSGDIGSDILRKTLKVGVLAAIAVMTLIIYLIFLIILKALEKEDVEIILAGLRRLGIPGGIIERMGRIMEVK